MVLYCLVLVMYYQNRTEHRKVAGGPKSLHLIRGYILNIPILTTSPTSHTLSSTHNTSHSANSLCYNKYIIIRNKMMKDLDRIEQWISFRCSNVWIQRSDLSKVLWKLFKNNKRVTLKSRNSWLLMMIGISYQSLSTGVVDHFQWVLIVIN